MKNPPANITPSNRVDPTSSRRLFLKSTAAASTLALLPQAVHAATNDTIKLGIVGCGGRGTGAAAQAMNADDGVKLVAVCDVGLDMAQQKVELLKKQTPNQVDVPAEQIFSGFEDYKNVISSCDVVILATSPGFRPLHFEEAVKQGKHVFMEKPVATDVRGIKRVLESARIAKEKNLKVGVGLQRRHQPTYQDYIKRIQDGALGDIVYMRAFWDGAARAGKEKRPDETELQYQIRNWYYFTWLSGDHNVEQHVHNLDVCNWAKGNVHPVRAQGMGGRQVRNKKINGQIFDHHFIEYEYADGTRMFSQSRQIPRCWKSVSESITGTLGEAHFERGRFSISGPKATAKRLRKGEDGHQLEHYPLFEAIRKNLPYNEAEHGANATMTAILGRMSNYSGQAVTWDEAMASNLTLVPDDLTSFDSTAPVQPDAEGWYPVAVPGQSNPYHRWY